MRYFILIKRKGAKKWIGAIPAKSGITKTRLQKSVRKSIKPGLTYRIITATQLKKIMSSLVNKKAKKRRTVKRKRIYRRRKK